MLTLLLTEMYATVSSAVVCDCLRLYGNNSLRSSAICDPRPSAIIWKPGFSSCEEVQFVMFPDCTNHESAGAPIHRQKKIYWNFTQTKLSSIFRLELAGPSYQEMVEIVSVAHSLDLLTIQTFENSQNWSRNTAKLRSRFRPLKTNYFH